MLNFASHCNETTAGFSPDIYQSIECINIHIYIYIYVYKTYSETMTRTYYTKIDKGNEYKYQIVDT